MTGGQYPPCRRLSGLYSHTAFDPCHNGGVFLFVCVQPLCVGIHKRLKFIYIFKSKGEILFKIIGSAEEIIEQIVCREKFEKFVRQFFCDVVKGIFNCNLVVLVLCVNIRIFIAVIYDFFRADSQRVKTFYHVFINCLIDFVIKSVHKFTD